MVIETQLQEALIDLRGLVSSDGADLALVTVDAGTVTLRLAVDDASCLDCVLPHDLLHSLIEGKLKQAVSSVDRVVLLDPRQ